MAGILIRGMEMPTSGQVIAIYKLQGKFYASANGTELCPLIEVPPHGRLIDADALYERAASLDAQALDYVGKLIERDGDEVSTEWRIWSAILAERTAFKHDVFDAPTVIEAEVQE